jgi:phosphoribosylamine-glycine ligase
MILTRDGPKTLEFNCRFGDPEAQVILLLLEADLVEIMLACIEGRLDEMDIRWKEGAAATIVLAAPGYPQTFPTGMAINGVKQANSLRDVYVFHAGTVTDTNGQLVTNGGRVVAVTAVGRQLEDAIRKAYGGAAQIHFEGAHYRRDIGREL